MPGLSKIFRQVVAQSLRQQQVEQSSGDGAAAEHDHHNPRGSLGLKT